MACPRGGKEGYLAFLNCVPALFHAARMRGTNEAEFSALASRIKAVTANTSHNMWLVKAKVFMPRARTTPPE